MTRALLESRRTLWVVAALALTLFLVTNLPWQLDDYDQAKQAYTSFEMVKAGHSFFQHTPHERIATKPPLVGWISVGIFSVTRSWTIAWRLPSLLSASALAILLFRAGSVYGAVGSVVSLSALAFNLLTPRLATLVRTDMPLALVVSAIGFLIWEKIRKREPWNACDRLSIFALLTAAMLIKGPIVYAFLIPGIVGFQWWRRKNEAITSWCGWWPWIVSLSIFLIWVIGGSIFVPGFYDQVVVREFLGRFGETIHRPQPFLFYFPHLLHKFFPWSVLIVALVVVDFRARQWKIRTALRGIAPETLWLICWIFGGLIVMSIIPSKRVDRIFPIIPPLCLLLAAQIGTASPNEQLHRHILRWSAVALVLSIFWTGGYAAFKITSGYRDHRDAWVKFGDLVRQRAEDNHWNFEAIAWSDEGFLLYLQKLHFIKLNDAIDAWDQNKIDALVVPVGSADELSRHALRNSVISPIRSEHRTDSDSDYVLITR
jgi:4-amino-4-deoxy-L-arabinose transferase-like glycosyltransferase